MATPEGLCTGCSATVVCEEHKPQSCWRVHKWGPWKWSDLHGGVGWVRVCKRCGIEQCK